MKIINGYRVVRVALYIEDPKMLSNLRFNQNQFSHNTRHDNNNARRYLHAITLLECKETYVTDTRGANDAAAQACTHRYREFEIPLFSRSLSLPPLPFFFGLAGLITDRARSATPPGYIPERSWCFIAAAYLMLPYFRTRVILPTYLLFHRPRVGQLT